MLITAAVIFSLMLEAAKLSGFEPVTKEELPIVTQLAPAELANKICGENWDVKRNCGKYKAAYFSETNELVYSDDINLDSDLGKSIIVHELVHVLQAKRFGTEKKTCDQLIDMELQAYTTQDRYMILHDHFDTHLRSIIPHMKCSPLTESKREIR